MSNAILWGTESWEQTGTPFAYCERLTHALQAGTKEVLDGDGVVKWRRNWGAKYRVDGTFIPFDVSILPDLRAQMLSDDYVLINDSDLGTIHVYLDTQAKERMAGEAGPSAERLHVTGWAYPALDPDAET
jgi:hypothetical protein